MFENALAQFWEHSDRCGWQCTAATRGATFRTAFLSAHLPGYHWLDVLVHGVPRPYEACGAAAAGLKSVRRFCRARI